MHAFGIRPDIIAKDIPHTVAAQTNMINNGKMDGWINPNCMLNGVNNCLTYYTRDQVPNLTTLADNRLSNIEVIDIRGSGANSLTLNQ